MYLMTVYEVPYAGSEVQLCESRENVARYLNSLIKTGVPLSDIKIYQEINADSFLADAEKLNDQ